MKNQSLFSAISSIISEKSILNHPFYQCWQAGKLTKEELQDYMVQYYHLENAFPRFQSSIHANTIDGDMRQMMLKDLINEEWADNNHVALLVRFAEALGLTKEQLINSKPNKNTEEAINTVLEMTADPDIAKGIAALAVYKEQIAKVAVTKEAGLKEFYGITAPEALQFFRVHSNQNVIWHNLLDTQVTKEAYPAVLASVHTMCDAWWHYLDGVTTPSMMESMVC